MRKKYQKGGFKYDKVGNTSITSKDVNKINKATGIQFTPEFSEAYFSTNTPPPTPPQKTDFSQIPIMDITMGGFGERRVWNIRPENLVGQEPQEGKHYYNVYPKQWDAYQKSPEYLNYVNKDRAGIASMQEGGEIEKYQPGGYKERGYNNPFIPKRKTTVPTSPQYSYPAPTPSNPNQPFTGYGVPMPKTPWEASGVTNKNYGRTVDAGGVAQQPATQATNLVTAPTSSAEDKEKLNNISQSWNEYNFKKNALRFADEQNPDFNYSFNPSLTTPYEYKSDTYAENFAKENPLPKGTFSEDLNSKQFLESSKEENPLTTSNQTQGQTSQPFQFNNYFNGVSIPQAAGYLGESIKNKDTLGIITSGTKLAAGLGRNILSGMGSQNRENQIMKQYTEEQRNVLTQANRPAQLRDQGYGEDMGYYYGQEGGQIGEATTASGQEEMAMQVAQALQQGADPQEVLQQLLQMGLEESEAIQLIEGIMQQMQQEVPQQEQPMMQNGGEYLNQIKGKRIVDYKFNPETGNYDIEYED